MSAASFQRLLPEFELGFAQLGSTHFYMQILVPGSFSSGDPPFECNRQQTILIPESYPNDDRSQNRKKPQLIASVCLPMTPAREVWTLDGFAVVETWPRAPDLFQTFKRMCGEAGAALPPAIRKRLVSYCPPHVRQSASWWIALLADALGLTACDRNGEYQVEHHVPDAWRLSIDLIQDLGLNTDSPRWPQCENRGADCPNVNAENAPQGVTIHVPLSDTPPRSTEPSKPHWNKVRGELTLDGGGIKKIQNLGPAVNVVKILDAFEEEGWPERIDDPLIGGKLRDAVRSLNANLSVIRFSRDGTGEGVRWERQ